MPAEIFTHEHRVTYADCTVGNHVYYGRYPDLLEAARGEFFRYLGKSFLEYQEEGVIFPVSEVHLKYFAFAEYDDELRIECRLTAIRGARLGFGYRITKGEGVRILEGETLHGCVEASGRATRLPPALKERLQPYLDSE
ncbi:MAG: thioesterase family protein [Verrucomicrobiales bacterium]|nr:thioesterase family protein [Verrucomicrobiales bacterium]|tara:strand:- start:104 stop:520 length:417 start_codon:yes stop_codon:yes gene_type:complete